MSNSSNYYNKDMIKVKKNRMKIGAGYRIALTAIILTFIAASIMSIVMVGRAETQRTETEGQMRLSNIAARADSSLYRSECLLDSVSMQIEQITSFKGDVSELLDKYFCPETIEDIKSRSDGSCFSAYAAYNGELYINGFTPDEDFVLEERAWYIGAKKRMGAVSITEPYLDASTGEMCYSL